MLALEAGLGSRDGAVVREITKLHEESVAGSLSELTGRYANADAPPKGEMVIVVAPPMAAEPASNEVIDKLLDDALARLSPSRAAAEVAEQLGIPRKRAYDRALQRSRK